MCEGLKIENSRTFLPSMCVNSFTFIHILQMRIISWNVNGIRAIKDKTKTGEKIKAGEKTVLEALIMEQNPDVLCFQEVKSANQFDVEFLRAQFPHIQFRAAEKKGYSGVAVLSKEAPLRVDEPAFPTSAHAFQKEGRVISVEFQTVRLVCVYTPNSKMGLERLEERQAWETLLRSYLQTLKELGKPVILCGDLNCAFSARLDIHNQRPKPGTPGVSAEERAEFQKMLEAGWVDSFRHLKPTETKYTFWSHFAEARKRNVGWRLDYCIVSSEYTECIQKADCLNEYGGSDHCPIVLEFV
jgi:exodeoxyribonuclease-3